MVSIERIFPWRGGCPESIKIFEDLRCKSAGYGWTWTGDSLTWSGWVQRVRTDTNADPVWMSTDSSLLSTYRIMSQKTFCKHSVVFSFGQLLKCSHGFYLLYGEQDVFVQWSYSGTNISSSIMRSLMNCWRVKKN